MTIGLFILGILLFVLYDMIQTKIDFLERRSNGKQLSATVVGFKREHKEIRRNHYEFNYYPLVKIDSLSNDQKFKVEYAYLIFRPFEKMDKIKVFWSGNKLLYWDRYSSGILSFLPPWTTKK